MPSVFLIQTQVDAKNFMTIRIDRLLQRYKDIEERFVLINPNSHYADLVTASANQSYPVQRWFHFKEAFSLDLLQTLITDWGIESRSIKRVLDPFLGTGTSLLAVQRLAKKLHRRDLQAVGLERNPFLHFVSQTKSLWHTYEAEEIHRTATALLQALPESPPDAMPTLSTLSREDVYSREILEELLDYHNAIKGVLGDEKAPLLLGYASVLEDLSGVRKDGRALRIVPNKQYLFESVTEALQTAWCEVSEDNDTASNIFETIPTEALYGDGRLLVSEGENAPQMDDFDITIYSPPYINNIDYTEVYKLELWLCGFITNKADFRSLRYKTFRSHPSVKFQSPIVMSEDCRLVEVQKDIKALTDALPQDKDRNWRTDLFRGYFDDMYQSLVCQQAATNNGGWIFCVVGNSLHGSSKSPELRVPVAADLIIAAIAEAIGLEVKAIQVARQLKRRSPDNHLMRESIIVMRKPERKVLSDGR